MRRISVLFLLLASLISPVLAGGIEGVEYLSLNINGKVYETPNTPDPMGKQVLLLARYLDGDTFSLKLLMQGNESQHLFIGDIEPLWVEVKKDGTMRVYEP